MARIDFQKNDTYRNAYDGILRLTKHVSSVDELPEIGPSNGDIYSVGEDNSLYIYNGSWAPMGSGSGTTEHMIVHGEISQGEGGNIAFVPNDDEQPTFAEAVEAFEGGIPVVLVADSGESSVSSNVLCRMSFSGGTLLVAFFGEGYMSWTGSESPDPGPDPVQ